MTSSLSRRHTLRESLPSFFDIKQSWPNPADSVGQECLRIHRLRCWQVVGPALEAMEKLSLPIIELLDKHKEIIEQGESKTTAVSFNMWMIGHLPISADPTIVFSSKSKRQRTCAKALLKESKILDRYPGIKIKALDKIPAIYQSADRSAADVSDTVSEDGVYMVDDSRGPYGALIAFGNSRMATMGGVLLINGTHYGISAQHARLRSLPEQEEFSSSSDSPCFDDDSDTESEDVLEITSKASVSSQGEDADSLSTLQSDSVFDLPTISQQHTNSRYDIQSGTGSINAQSVKGRRISTLSASFVENDLDYELFQLTDPNLQSHNTARSPQNQGIDQTLVNPNHVVRNLVESNVWVATGTTGLVYGTILRAPHFIKMERSQSFQEMWAVSLDRRTMQGDCGAWVIDAVTGGIYGHIVAGDPFTGLAFIIPAYRIFDDIALRFGSMPSLPTEPKVTTSRALLASVHPKQQLNRCVQFESARLLNVFLFWLLWRLANLRMPFWEREQLIQLILYPKAWRQWHKDFEILVDPANYVYHLLFQAHDTPRQYLCSPHYSYFEQYSYFQLLTRLLDHSSQVHDTSQQSQSRHKSRFVYYLEKFDFECHQLRLTPHAIGHDIGVSYQSFHQQNYDQAKSSGCLPADNRQSSSSGSVGGRPSTAIKYHEPRGLNNEDKHTMRQSHTQAIPNGADATGTWIADHDPLLQEHSNPIAFWGDERDYSTTYSLGIPGPDPLSLSYASLERGRQALTSNHSSLTPNYSNSPSNHCNSISNHSNSPLISPFPALQDTLLTSAQFKFPFDMLGCNSYSTPRQMDDWHKHSLSHFRGIEPPTCALPATRLVDHSRDGQLSRSMEFKSPVDSWYRMSKRKGNRARHMDRAHDWAHQPSNLVNPNPSPAGEDMRLVRLLTPDTAGALATTPLPFFRDPQRDPPELQCPFNFLRRTRHYAMKNMNDSFDFGRGRGRRLSRCDTVVRETLAVLPSSLDGLDGIPVDVHRQDQVRKSNITSNVVEVLADRSIQQKDIMSHRHDESSTLVEHGVVGLRRSWTQSNLWISPT